MEFILDFQGFKDENNEFIIKELALISTDEDVYELQLFQPPYHFNQLAEDVRKQVVWLEKQYHGLCWNSGSRNYTDLKDILKCINGTVFVKGDEKQKFVNSLLSQSQVNVRNIENLGCPSLSILKQQSRPFLIQPCPFNHNSKKNCAYENVYIILNWLKLERYAEKRIEKINLAIKECFNKGYKNLETDLVKCLPKDFILNYHEEIEIIYDKLPEFLQSDEDIQMNMICNKHYCKRGHINSSHCTWDGPNPKRKHCHFCKAKQRLCCDINKD